MEGAFAWLGDLVRFIASLFPRLVIVRATHAGVAWSRGKYTKIWQPGLHVYWPFITEYELYPTVTQTINLPTQTLVTADNVTVAVSGIVWINIKEIELILGQVWDPEQTISDICLTAVKQLVLHKTMAHLLSEQDAVDKHLRRLVQKAVRRFGVVVKRATLSDVSPCRVFKLWGDENVARRHHALVSSVPT